MPCRSSTACRFPDDVLHEASICFSSLPLAEWEGLLGMPTSTNVSEPKKEINTDVFFNIPFYSFLVTLPRRVRSAKTKESVSVETGRCVAWCV